MAAPAPHRTETLTEYHWSAERHGRITELCEDAAEEAPEIRSLSHYSNGILDFVVCHADRAPLSSLVTEADDDLHDESLPGSRLLLCAQDLGAVLRPLGTGELMRTVVANERGGLWGGRVKPGEYLAALTDGPNCVPAMDATMNALVTRIRTEVHRLPDELPGGTPDAKPRLASTDAGDAPLRVDFGTAAAPVPAYEQRLRSLWHKHVNITDLQYAGYYRDWTLVCVGDVFDAPDLAPRFLDVSVRSRRTAYRDLSRGLRGHLVRLTDALHLVAPPAEGLAPVQRLVLDVQEGAVYVTWLSPREFVVGVTLDQPQVGHAEARLRRLAHDLGEIRAQ
ncbi:MULTISPECIES: hypothetical protein [Streptomyces]|uniref:Uncharacterized protein n=1 Tax=Streptomyces dengpaensis TaxID=2049881 RepID=A0ABM6SYD2_9ACTN|nr:MULTISPECIES: hypothetical protein [Streptomyces]AVH59647.1 hypothetical protein C4B68_32235 [Streptomyces dengpaensis]PIB06914.1 hypothetical protein B1C81_22900 [Streptomyces sp. HG99]